MEFETIIGGLKEQLTQLFGDKYKEFGKASKKDINAFLDNSKEKLERWTLLLAEEKLTPDDFQWLVTSQKDLLTLKALEKAGVSKISLGHFKNTVIDAVFNTVLGRLDLKI